MAVSEPSGRAEKRVLECSNIEISGVRYEMEHAYKLATLVIGRFYLMKNDVEYVKPFSEVEGDIRFIRKRNSHTIKITGNDLGRVSASILYEDIKTSRPYLAEQAADGGHVVVFPSSAVENAQNTHLKSGGLVIHIKFGESEKLLKRLHACSGKRDNLSEERLVEDLEKSICIYSEHTYIENSICIDPQDTDIILHADEQEIRIPKGLLASRSNYFKLYPDGDNCIYLCTYYETLFDTVQYLYTGKLRDVEELTEQQICRLLEIAMSLKIKSLETKCLSLINQLIIQGDLETVKLTAKCGESSLHHLPSST